MLSMTAFPSVAQVKRCFRHRGGVGRYILRTREHLRFLEINPEDALRKTISKFIHRFRYIEENAAEAGRNLKEMTLGRKRKRNRTGELLAPLLMYFA
jgi:uncharacterized protein YabN with tetrapyrrole methylase and pyrophosphatase domain